MKCFVKSLILYAGSLIYHETSQKVVFYHDIGKAYTPMETDVRTFMKHMKVLGVGGRCRCRGVCWRLMMGLGGFLNREMLKEMKARGEGEQWKIKVFVAPRQLGNLGI